MIKTIEKLEEYARLSAKVSNIVEELSSPIVFDLDIIEDFYNLRYNGRNIAIVERKAFVCVMLYFFCPAALAGCRRLHNGLRDKLASVLKSQPTTISHDYMVVRTLYKQYDDFKRLTDSIYEDFKEYLNNNALIPNR